MASAAPAPPSSTTTTTTTAAAASSRRHVLANYEKIGVIGKGSFGTVSKVRRKSDGRILVWKELNYGHMREKEKQLVVSEVNILRELRHPFIVRYYDRIIDKATTKLYIVMEHCEGGDLGRVIKKCKKERTFLDEQLIWKFFAQIVLALKECHHRGDGTKRKPILHRDIKPGNIFLDSNRNVKVGDFGLAKELGSASKFAHTNVGTPFYMSPEMINELKYNDKSDIWATGCLLYELAALRPPFEATNHVALAVKINAGRFPRIPARYSDQLQEAIRWMLSTSQSKRPSVTQLERLPQVRRYAHEATLAVRECQLNHAHGAKMRAAATAEADMKRRVEAVEARERAVAKREREVAAREAAVRAAEKRVVLAGSNSNSNSSSKPSAAAYTGRPSLGSENIDSSSAAQRAVAPPPVPVASRRHSYKSSTHTSSTSHRRASSAGATTTATYSSSHRHAATGQVAPASSTAAGAGERKQPRRGSFDPAPRPRLAGGVGVGATAASGSIRTVLGGGRPSSHGSARTRSSGSTASSAATAAALAVPRSRPRSVAVPQH